MSCRFSQNSSKGTMRSLIVLLYGSLWVVKARGSENLLSFPLQYRPPSEDINFSNTNTRRRLQGNGDGYTNRYDGYGVHFIDLFIGNPSQKRTLAVQTASDHTAFACEDCRDCGERGVNVYNHTRSSEFSSVQCSSCTANAATCENDRCTVSYEFRDLSSWKGYEVTDAVYIGGARLNGVSPLGTDVPLVHGFPLRFVCQTRARGYYANRVQDGVLGISPAPTSFISQMHAAGKLPRPRVSLCFNVQSTAAAGGQTQKGVVTLGGYDAAFLTTEVVYAKNVGIDKYQVNIVRLYLRLGGGTTVMSAPGQQSLTIELPQSVDGGTDVNSGIPYLTFDERLEAPFRQAWKQVTGSEFSYVRLELTEEQILSLPTLLIEIEGVDSPRDLDPDSVPNLTNDYNVLLAVPATHYLEKVVNGRYRARIQFDGQTGSLLGANAMQGHTTVYELDNNRIGFAESRSCRADPPSSGGGSGGSGTSQQGSGGGTSTGSSGGSTSGSNGSSGGTPGGSTTGGTTGGSSSQGGTGAGGTSIGVDDDLFIPDGGGSNNGNDNGNEGQESDELDVAGGGCTTAMCRSFLAVGYVLVGTSLAVAYRVSRPREKSFGAAFAREEPDAGKPLKYSDEDTAYNSAYRRKGGWNEDERSYFV